MNIRQNLVEDFAKFHKWWSVRLAAISAAIQGMVMYWPNIPQAWRDSLPSWMLHALAVSALVTASGAIGARIVKQK